MKSRLVFWLVAALLVLAQLWGYRGANQQVFKGSGGGHYAYLPDYFLYGGPGRADSLNHLLASQSGQPRPLDQLGMRRLPSGKVLINYPLGVALGQLPWFAGAHLYARWHGNPPNGASWPYQRAVLLAGLVYALVGLWVLRKLLRRYFPDQAVAWVLGAIALGTSLLGYATYGAARPPAALFMWQAALLYCTARWFESPRRRWAAGIGLFWALAVLGRFSEAVYALVPLAWGLGAGRRPAVLGRYLDQLLLAAGLAAVVLSLQLFYWHAVSGDWLAGGHWVGLSSLRLAHLLEEAMGTSQGWLLHLPLLMLALLGIGWLRYRVLVALAPVLGVVLVAALLRVVGGAEFSLGLLSGAWPLLALPLAALLATAATRGSWVWVGLRALLVAGIVLTLWQTWRWHGGLVAATQAPGQYLHRVFGHQPPRAAARAELTYRPAGGA
jgi:hypothetical protein